VKPNLTVSEGRSKLRAVQRALKFGAITGLAAGISATQAGRLWAQAPDTAASQKRALELFSEARRLQNQGRPGEACELFRRSAELLPGPGILLNLGQCFEREGNAIGALETYERALAAAEQHPTAAPRQRAAWADEARHGIEAQRLRVAAVVIRAKTPGLSLELDGRSVEPRSEPYRVAPGRHEVEAMAPGRVSFRRELTARPGETEYIVVPELEPEVGVQSKRLAEAEPVPAEPPPAQSSSTPGAEGGSSSVLPWVLVTTGSALVGTGIVTGFLTTSRSRELEENCRSGTCPSEVEDPGWQDKIDEAKQLALITNVLWGVGLATAGVGVTWLLLGGDDDASEAPSQLQAGCFGGACGVLLRGGF
jgi:hypothetical protein